MRLSTRFLKLGTLLSLIAVVSISSLAAPPEGKGGGNDKDGDDGGGSAPSSPPVQYQVGFNPVPGLTALYDVNDAGKSLCLVEIDTVPISITSLRNHTLAVVDLGGNVTYPEATLNTAVDWDLEGWAKLNNAGQILCDGRTLLEDGSFYKVPLLLTPMVMGDTMSRKRAHTFSHTP